jgi:uncharacterized protein YjbI with pentapeptide repeats
LHVKLDPNTEPAWIWTHRRLAVMITAGILLLVILYVLLVPGPDWLARHDVGSATGSLHEAAVDSARGRLLTLGAGLLAAGALLFAALNFFLSRHGQVTDRYTKAIEQLGSDKLDVRIGGIFALERIARDSARDHPTVMEVLTAFIREHSHEPSPPVPVGRDLKGWTRPDVQAAVTVVGRRDQEHDIPGNRLDLIGANLTGGNLVRARLFHADLFGADLSGARLWYAHLASAQLGAADLTRARLHFASLYDADLHRAVLAGADLTHARLDRAILVGADLTGATLHGAALNGANLNGATLDGAQLDGAQLDGAQLDGTIWPRKAAVPAGWKRDPRSDRLSAADPGGETPEAG